MCGITGFIDSSRNLTQTDLLSLSTRMADALIHRGPDDGGAWADMESGIGLGQRRLSIVDLSPEGHQPMVSAAGRLVLVFNGEIYNFGKLRKELENLGHQFRASLKRGPCLSQNASPATRATCSGSAR